MFRNPVIGIIFSALCVMLFYLVLRIIYCFVNKSKLLWKKEIVPCIFALYIGALISILITRNMRMHLIDESGAIYLNVFLGDITARKFNLIPFKTIAEQISYLLNGNAEYSPLTNLAGNLVLFLPMPILIKLSNKKIKGIFVILITLIVVVIFETMQYVTGRVADIDDVIFNMLGALIGLAFYCLIAKKFEYRLHK